MIFSYHPQLWRCSLAGLAPRARWYCPTWPCWRRGRCRPTCGRARSRSKSHGPLRDKLSEIFARHWKMELVILCKGLATWRCLTSSFGSWSHSVPGRVCLEACTWCRWPRPREVWGRSSPGIGWGRTANLLLALGNFSRHNQPFDSNPKRRCLEINKDEWRL